LGLVNSKVKKKWIKCYPTMQKLARAHEKSVLNSWEGLGYYSRVRNIHKAANYIRHLRMPSLLYENRGQTYCESNRCKKI